MLRVQAAPGLSESDLDLAARLVEADGGRPTSPSYALIARILKEDRSVTPDADLSALLSQLEGQEHRTGTSGDITADVARDSRGSAGFAFDCTSLKITSVKKNRRDLASIHVGDTIVAVNGTPVTNAKEYHRLAKHAQDFRLSLRRTEQSVPPPPPPAPAQNATHAAQGQFRRKAAPKRPARGRGSSPARGPSPAELEAMAMDIDRMSYEDLLALDDLHPPVKAAGLPEKAMGDYPVEHICGGGGECAICLEDFCDGEQAMRLPCAHKFHVNCAQEWLKRQSRCPYCNFELKG
mmetsp:Transcript_22053/g.38836  ORF Transcript_22053/g.38836 Transcript_22053/m.38836 type:complete len:293 (+) Transcript_22053:64-942(+)